jgi:hypothetical protein
MRTLWPEFLYEGKTIDEYLEMVINEQRDVKKEIEGLVDLIQDIAKYPYTPQQNLSIIRALCAGIRALLTKIHTQ